MTAVYTAYLFAQAKARDLWQNPLLPPHLLVQALAVGAARCVPFAVWLAARPRVARCSPILAGASLVHVLLVVG